MVKACIVALVAYVFFLIYTDTFFWKSQGVVVNRLDTALHITVLHHSFYVGAISIWGGAGTTKRSGVIARPDVH
jgi:hypothetical protein